MPDQWLVVVTGPKLIDELRKFPDDTMSLPRGLEEVLVSLPRQPPELIFMPFP